MIQFHLHRWEYETNGAFKIKETILLREDQGYVEQLIESGMCLLQQHCARHDEFRLLRQSNIQGTIDFPSRF
jgi:hypothetical protein